MRCSKHGDYTTPQNTFRLSYPLGWVTNYTPLDSLVLAQSKPMVASLVHIYGVSTYVNMWAIHDNLWAICDFSASALAGAVGLRWWWILGRIVNVPR